MTKGEVNKLLLLMKASYSYAFKGMSQQDLYMLVNTWAFTLQDISADVVMIAVMQLISTSKWMPTVAEIREKCAKLYNEAYCAAYSPVVNLDDEAPTDDELRIQEASRYIVSATAHLDKHSPGLSLNAILKSPVFAGIGTGRPCLALLGNTTHEITDNKELGHEQGYPDRQLDR